jgi:hypothetical protein
MRLAGWQGRMGRLAALSIGLAAVTPSLSLNPLSPKPAPQISVTATAAAQAADSTLQTTYTSKLCDVYNTGKQLVFIALGIGILVVVVLSIGSRFRTGLFITLVASVIIVATTDQLMGFLNKDAQFNCKAGL